MATDKKRQSVAYWETRLKRMGLSMEAGQHIAREKDGGLVRWISYGYNVCDLDYDGKKLYPTTSTQGDVQEWPISL